MKMSSAPLGNLLAQGSDTAASDNAQLTDPDFLRSVLASSADCIKVLDLDANLIFMTEAGQRIMEISDFNAVRGCPWPDFWRDQSNLDAKAAIETARAGGVGRFQGRTPTFMGTPKWWDVQVTPIAGADGKPHKLLSVSRDITAQKVAEERQHLLHQELAHRVKNTLTMVQAIAAQTFRGDVRLGDATAAFTDRLLALAKANDVLMQASWTEASLGSIVEAATRIHGAGGAGRFDVRGVDVHIGPKAALSFALALHELGTNAVKYGSLSVPGGRVEIAWATSTAVDPRLRFSWTELGGPPVTPPVRTGFGSRLIDRTLASSLHATVSLDYPASGARLTVEGPLSAMQEA